MTSQGLEKMNYLIGQLFELSEEFVRSYGVSEPDAVRMNTLVELVAKTVVDEAKDEK
jgi:hypothetical protein